MSKQEEFFSAIAAGHVDKVREALLADPSLVNAKNENGISAVLFALYNGKNEMARLIIDRGARLDLFEAAASGTQERVEQLLHKDPAAINQYSPDGWTALHLAVFFGRVNIVHFLLSKGANIDAPSKNDELVAPPLPWQIRTIPLWDSFSSERAQISMHNRLSEIHPSTMLQRTAWSRLYAACWHTVLT